MRIIDASISSYVKEILQTHKEIEIVSSAESLDILLDYAEFDDPDLVILSKDMDHEPQGENLIQIIKRIREIKPLVRFIVLVPKYNKRFFQRLVNLGIFSIVLYDDIEEKLIKEMNEPRLEFNFEEYEQATDKREYINKITKGFKRVIAVYSAEATGKSFVAANLAYITAGQGIKTALVDGDFNNRALSYYYYINESKQNGLKELFESNAIEKKESYAHTILDGKLNIFTSNRYNGELKELHIKCNSDRFMNIIDYLRAENEVVFIDTNKSIDDEITKKTLSMADTILLIQNMDYRMMEHNKAVLKSLEDTNISLNKIVLVINRYIENKDLTEKTIEKYFEHRFAGRATITEDTLAAIKNIRYGKPAVSMKDCSEKTIEAFLNLSSFCYGIERIEKRKGGMLSRLLRLR